MKKRENYYLIRSIPALSVLIVLFILPLIAIVLRAFSDGGRTAISVFTDRYTYRLLSFTLKEAVLSAFISVLAAIPFSAFFSHYAFPGRKAMLTLSELSFTMPSILVVLGFVIWYGNNGILNSALRRLLTLDEPPLRILYSFKAIILAHVYLNFPIAFALLTADWTNEGNSEELASYLLGKSRLYTFFRITLPKLRGTLLSAFMLIFLYCFSSFSIVLVLGGKPSYYTLEAEIYKRTYTTMNMASSASLSLFALAITSVMLIITGGGKRREKAVRCRKELKKAKGRLSIAAAVLSLMILLFILPPILSIAYRAFFTKNGSFTLKAWKDLRSAKHGNISGALDSIFNSLIIAVLTAAAATSAGTSIALAAVKRKLRLLDVLASLPMAAGSVTLGLGFAIISSYFHNSGVISYAMVLLSHIVITLPFAVRTLIPGARNIPETLAYASYSLNGSLSGTLRKVEIPLLRPYRRKAFAFAFVISLGEVNATLTFSGGQIKTLPVLLYNMISSYNYQGASVLGIILLLEALIIFASEERSI